MADYREPATIRRKINECEAEIAKLNKTIDAHRALIQHFEKQLARRERMATTSQAGSSHE